MSLLARLLKFKGRPLPAVPLSWTLPLVLLAALSFLPFLIPMADIIPEPAQSTLTHAPARKHPRVLLIIIDGLGLRKALDPGWMPRLQDRVPRSAFGIGVAPFPTLTPTGLRAILGGHRSVPEPEFPGGVHSNEERDSVLARASAANLRAVVFGQFSWDPLFHGHGVPLHIIPYHGILIRYDHNQKSLLLHYDQDLLAMAEPYLNGSQKWDFMVLHLFEQDPIGHITGTEDELYKHHLLWVDAQVERLTNRLLAQEPTTVLLLADHGMTAAGTHGGLTPTERRVPFMLWGAGIRPGKLGTFPLFNAAPTLSALLGIPPPIASRGWPMLGAMRLSPEDKATILLDLLNQRMERWNGIHAVWPWLSGNPAPQIKNVERLMAAGKADVAANLAQAYVRNVDSAMEDALPERWFGRLIIALWALALAACFGLAWSGDFQGMPRAALPLGVFLLLLLALPLLFPNSWPWASMLQMLLALCLTALGFIPGFSRDSGMSWGRWIFWSLAFAVIAVPEVMDTRLWAWSVVWGMIGFRFAETRRWKFPPAALVLLPVLSAALISLGRPVSDSSLVRQIFPDSPRPLAIPWNLVDGAACVFLAAGAYRGIAKSRAPVRARAAWMLALMPLIAVFLLASRGPAATAWSWLVCFFSLAGAAVKRIDARARGIWLSLIALAFYRTMASGTEWTYLSLATLAGWGFAWNEKEDHPLWEGLLALGILFWSYSLTQAQLLFSNITIAEGYKALGEGWHPHELVFLLVLKHAAAMGAPLLPWLANRSFKSVLGTLPFLGALAAGDLSSLWLDRFLRAGITMITNQPAYLGVVFASILAWMLCALHGLASACGWIPVKLRDSGLAEP